MKKLHLHISVEDLSQSITFYSALFGAKPTTEKSDYAKWLLDDPAVNFAISQRSSKTGVDHIGIQAENEAELAELKSRIDAAEMAVISQEGTTCCYAESDKHWVQDPTGIAWETYLTLAEVPTFNNAVTNEAQNEENACCAPMSQTVQILAKSIKNTKNEGCC